MTIHLGIEQATVIVDKLGFFVRDAGLLASALARPAASMFGNEAYATLEMKAAALFSSLAQNRPLADGNKRFAMIFTFAFLETNGWQLTFSNDEAFGLVLAVAQSRLELDEIAARLAAHTVPRP